MKTFGLILAGMFCAAAQGAISDMLFATGDGTFAGAPGNFGAGKFCVLYAETGLPTVVRLLAPEVLPDLRLINPHRANGTLAFNFGGPASNIQISTNLVDWEPSWHGQLPPSPNRVARRTAPM